MPNQTGGSSWRTGQPQVSQVRGCVAISVISRPCHQLSRLPKRPTDALNPLPTWCTIKLLKEATPSPLDPRWAPTRCMHGVPAPECPTPTWMVPHAQTQSPMPRDGDGALHMCMRPAPPYTAPQPSLLRTEGVRTRDPAHRPPALQPPTTPRARVGVREPRWAARHSVVTATEQREGIAWGQGCVTRPGYEGILRADSGISPYAASGSPGVPGGAQRLFGQHQRGAVQEQQPPRACCTPMRSFCVVHTP